MSNSRKGFFFDIDETLTSELDGAIPDSVSKAFEIIQSHGDLIFINTGRTFLTIPEKIRALRPDGYICGCGTSICDQDGALLWKGNIPELRAAIEEAAAIHKVDVLFEGREVMSFLVHSDPITAGCQHLIDRYTTAFPGHVMELQDPAFDYDKFVCWSWDKSSNEKFAEEVSLWYEKIDRNLHCGCSFFEMVPHGCSKGNGLRQVCDLKEIPMENTYAFGDSSNDMEMLKAASHAIVMANSEFEEVLKIATEIADKASEDGIYKMICKIYGIE